MTFAVLRNPRGGSMKNFCLIAAIVSLAPAAAWAQDSLATPVLPGELVSTELLQERIGHMRLSLSISGRISIPGDGTVSTAGVFYSDLFDVGAGGGLEGDLMMAVGGGLEIGGYLSGTYDAFGGASATDDFGNMIDPDTL